MTNYDEAPMRLQLYDVPLVGRSKETAALSAAYDRARDSNAMSEDNGPQIVMVGGRSGTGKSSLVEDTMRKQEEIWPMDFQIGEYNTYYCSGKFNQVRSTEPFSALKQAFSELFDSILNTRDRESICDGLKEALGPEGKILDDVVPGISTLIGSYHDVVLADTQGSAESFFRLTFLFKVFVRTLCEHRRFVLFLDDLQWADQSTVDLVEAIVTDGEIHQFLFIGTYRDDEVGKDHALAKMIAEVEKARHIEHIEVGHLDVESVDEVIRHLTNCQKKETEPVSKIVHRKTLGNSFMVREFLQLLEAEKYIEYSLMKGRWTFKVEEIAERTFLHDSVVEIVAERIQRLPRNTQNILKLSACLWSRFHAPSLLSILTGLQSEDFAVLQTYEDVINALDAAVDESLLDRLPKDHYKFSHDRIQESAYSLIPEGKERDLYHLRIGEVLYQRLLRKGKQDWMVFIAADQLNHGSKYMANQAERLVLAQLNLDAAEKAIKMSAFMPASNYLAHGIRLLGEDRWAKHYQLTLRLYGGGAEIAMCMGENKRCSELAQEVIQNSRCLTDRAPVYMSLINSYGNQTEYAKAMALSLTVLRELEEPFPKKANMGQVLVKLFKTKAMFKGKSDEDILKLPLMTDERKKIAMIILNKYSVHALLQQRSTDMLLCLITSARLTLKYGLHNLSPSAICAYGLVLGSLGNIKEGIRYGELAMKLLKQLNAKEWEANCVQIFNIFLNHWKQPYSECVTLLADGYKVGMTYGDIEFAFYNAAVSSMCFYFAGLNLEPCEADCRLYCQQMRAYNRENNYTVCGPFWQCVMNLQGKSVNPLMLTGEAIDESDFVEKATREDNIGALQGFWIFKGQVCYYFGDMNEARRVLIEFGKTKANLATHIYCTTYGFFFGLVSLDLCRTTGKRKYKTAARKMIHLLEVWVKSGNSNLAHKLLLLRAEYESLTEKKEKEVRRLYDSAIVAASRAGFLQDAALGNERAGIWFCDRSSMHGYDEFWARSYIERAHVLYCDWSAHAKAGALVKQYPTFFGGDASSSLEKTIAETAASQSTRRSVRKHPGVAASSVSRPSENASLQGSSRKSGTSVRGVQRYDEHSSTQHTQEVSQRRNFYTKSSREMKLESDKLDDRNAGSKYF